ncbi:MAG: hypothetical protein JWP57_3947 [Spirosoma sp.]|nr:hypothetical protein [Spirosoma sp.]
MIFGPILVKAQTTETHHYAIEVAGIRVGTMTAVHEQHTDNRSTYTLISDVSVKLLVYTIKIYYKAISQFSGKKLMLATVDAQTNRGNYLSRTEWKGDRYVISARQYKYDRQSVERNPIDFSVSLLYFNEPVNRNKTYAEYFGDYFNLTKTADGTYRALLDDREDEYIYEKGRLVKVIKHNKLKNFNVRRLD